MKPNLIDLLSKSPLLGDGAMGTQLFLRGMQPGVCGELWNVEKPAQIRDIHALYAEAGCDIATTNTFGATPLNLSKHGCEKRVAEICQAAVQRAREGASTCIVVGDIGPFGGFLEPLGDVTFDQAKASFAEQAKALAEDGVDAILIETMTDLEEMRAAIQGAKSVCDLPVCATFSFDRGDGTTFRTMMGLDVSTALQMAVDEGAAAVGANCGSGMGLDDYARLADVVVAACPNVPKILQPNAGAPRSVDGRLVYDATPGDMAVLAGKLKAAGIRWIGGCCGTTPDHLEAMREAV